MVGPQLIQSHGCCFLSEDAEASLTGTRILVVLLTTDQGGPWEMRSLRTPIIIIALFLFVKENQYVHSEIIFSVDGWISFHP